MTDQRKIEIMMIIGHFRNVRLPLSNEVIQEFCNLNKISETVSAVDLKDYIFQAEMDEKIAKMLPEILEVLKTRIHWIPLFQTDAAHKNQADQESLAIADLMDIAAREEIPYYYIESVIENMSNPLKAFFQTAATVAKNRSTRTFEGISKEKFGHDMTMGDVARYLFPMTVAPATPVEMEKSDEPKTE